MGDMDKASLRANIVERKRFEQLVSIYESSKRNLISDMRKSQASYRRKLKVYRERKREIIMSRSKNSDSAMEELFLEQMRSRNHVGPRPMIKSLTSINGNEAVEPLSRHTTLVSDSIEPDDDGSKIFKSRLSTYTSELNNCSPRSKSNSDSGTKEQLTSNELIITVESVVKTSETEGSPSDRKHLLTVKTLPGRTNATSSPSPSQTSADTQDLQTLLTADVKPSTAPTTKANPNWEKGHVRSSALPSIQRAGLRENSANPDEIGFEMPRSSSRQRSRLDLRPRTAWELLNLERVSDDRRQAGNRERFQKRLAGNYRQIVYLDNDEVQERGTFYSYLLKGRLEREHSRFADICHKVQDFCRSPGLFLVVKDADTLPANTLGERPLSNRRYSMRPTPNTKDMPRRTALKQF
ncbi:hypothetical protein Bpfe_023566 [Biomphalaria pfeifferi]|uniref:Uncharacterized protein n=1 Tax=Biomphalaria pfeifferi TaxID=112525 RepID=A0AAD8F1A5_BIOPF|nr:hypothetical protein Bpfe_023566 [Biomphalaria pfeifferi]